MTLLVTSSICLEGFLTISPTVSSMTIWSLNKRLPLTPILSECFDLDVKFHSLHFTLVGCQKWLKNSTRSMNTVLRRIAVLDTLLDGISPSKNFLDLLDTRKQSSLCFSNLRFMALVSTARSVGVVQFQNPQSVGKCIQGSGFFL